MSTRSPAVPPMRPKRPVDDLFSDTSRPAPAPEKNQQVMVYMQPGMVADLDDMRTDLRRRDGIRIDRSALVRAAIRLARSNPDLWANEARED